MTSEDHQFDEFCQRHGLGELATSINTDPQTLVACEAFNLFFRGECERFRNTLAEQFHKRININFNFCSNPSLNAFAARHSSGLYLIGINTGSLVDLGWAYEELLSKAPSLSHGMEFGRAKEQLSSQQMIHAVAYFAALHFLFYHELGHIAYGHADLLSSQTGQTLPVLSEATATLSSAPLSPDLCQSMEVDADLHAASSMINAAVTEGVLCGLKMTDFLNSRTDILKVGSIAILLMFHLFYGGSVDILTYRLQTHPLPEIRFLKFWMRAGQIRDNLSGQLYESAPVHPLDEFATLLPPSVLNSLFPALRLEGGVNIQEEAKRIRANEDKYERQLRPFAMIPVGGVICYLIASEDLFQLSQFPMSFWERPD